MEEPSGTYTSAGENTVEQPALDSCLIAAQGAVQTFTRPALWAPVCRYPHYYFEAWNVVGNSVADWIRVLQDATRVADRKELNHQSGKRLIFHSSDVDDNGTGRALVQCYTKAGWLDLVEFTIRVSGFNAGRLDVQVYGYSTGYYPLRIPGAFLCNIACFWCPFGDNGFTAMWMEMIRDSGAAATVVEATRKI